MSHRFLHCAAVCLCSSRMKDAKLREKESMKVRPPPTRNRPGQKFTGLISRVSTQSMDSPFDIFTHRSGGDPRQHRPSGPRGVDREGADRQQGTPEGTTHSLVDSRYSQKRWYDLLPFFTHSQADLRDEAWHSIKEISRGAW